MLSNPKIGQSVQVRYRKSVAARMPLHGKVGLITRVGRKRPRNHEVLIGLKYVIVPAGNLVKI